jgi:hypothetical protein
MLPLNSYNSRSSFDFFLKIICMRSANLFWIAGNLLVSSGFPRLRAASHTSLGERVRPEIHHSREVRSLWSGRPRRTTAGGEYEQFFPTRA